MHDGGIFGVVSNGLKVLWREMNSFLKAFKIKEVILFYMRNSFQYILEYIYCTVIKNLTIEY
jgi:hypothetical protein